MLRHGGTLGQDAFPFKTTLHFACSDNFTLVGQPNLTCNAQGLWSSDKPTCVPLGKADTDRRHGFAVSVS